MSEGFSFDSDNPQQFTERASVTVERTASNKLTRKVKVFDDTNPEALRAASDMALAELAYLDSRLNDMQ